MKKRAAPTLPGQPPEGPSPTNGGGLLPGALDRADETLCLRLAVESAGIGIFDHDLATQSLRWDARIRDLFGLAAEDPVTYRETFLNALAPEDRAAVESAMRGALDPDGAGTFDCEFRVATSTRPLWISARGRRVPGADRSVRLVGTMRDITDAKRAEIALRTTEERYRLAARATNDAIWDWDLATDTVQWNEALTTAYGWAPDQIEPTGAWWLGRLHPDDRAAVEADIRAAIAGGAEAWNHDYRFLRADGTYADVLDRGYVVRDAAGQPIRMIGAMLDLTARNRAAAQFRAVFQGANIGIVQFDPRTVRAFAVNAKLCEIWGAPESEILGQSLARWTPPEDDDARVALHERLSTGQTLQLRLEKRYRRMDGTIIWARVNLVSQRLGDDVHATAMIEDITEEKRADARREALIALSDRLREMQTHADVVTTTAESLGRTLGVTRAGYAQVDPGGQIAAFNPDWTAEAQDDPTRALGLPTPSRSTLAASIERLARGDVISVGDIVATPDRVDDPEGYARLGMRAVIKVPVLRRGRLVGILYVLDRQVRDWSAGEITFAREVAERAWGGLTRIEADEQQRTLNRELSHRLKNTLAMVQAIASQTLRNVTDMDAAKEALAARLIALGKAHDILLAGVHESADMEAVMRGALSIHDDRQPGRFDFVGPSILLGSKAALSLALMLHELATNAAKYGALSLPDGRVSLAWTIEEADGGPTVRLAWSEVNGPRVTPPLQKGFGSRLIERGLVGAVGGTISLDYAPAGLICCVVAPLAGFQANG
ncbi:PAS domain-containing sensor histidine kinase [Methylobacterium sp. Leaf113]|uniref:PAS domain-containing sensor histidine kinase n=1 Tax=Methylobacterium sp. Leaf113 TaxID=1736259 RepID=UPI0009E78F31|nr:PAS domain S-box protein [Methylobacterium sp. Leaf113]